MAISSRNGTIGSMGVSGWTPIPTCAPVVTYGGNRSGQIRAGLGVNDDDVAAGFGDVLDVARRFLNHHVDDERDVTGVGFDGGDHLGAYGDRRDEMAVHDIDVDVVRATLRGGGHIITEPGKVSGQDGRGDLDAVVMRHVVDQLLSVSRRDRASAMASRTRLGAVPPMMSRLAMADSTVMFRMSCSK